MHRSPLAAAAVAAALLVPAAASAQSIGGFSVRPARFDPNDPATRAYFKHTVPAGGSFGARVVVSNTSDQPLELLVYPVDGLTGATSGTVFANRQDPLREAGQWVRLHVSRITVGPKSRRELPFAVKVPDGATPGDHVAGIALEGAHPRSSGGKFQVTQVIRAVVGIKVTVDGAASKALRVGGATLQPLPGTKMSSVVVNLANTGRSLCKPRLSVALAGAGRPVTVTRRLDTVLPGDTIPYPLAWPRALGKGSYHVTATTTGCGAPSSVSTTASLEQPLGGTGQSGPAPAQAAEARSSTPSWWAIAGVGAAGVAAGAGVSALRRRLRLRKAAA